MQLNSSSTACVCVGPAAGPSSPTFSARRAASSPAAPESPTHPATAPLPPAIAALAPAGRRVYGPAQPSTGTSSTPHFEPPGARSSAPCRTSPQRRAPCSRSPSQTPPAVLRADARLRPRPLRTGLTAARAPSGVAALLAPVEGASAPVHAASHGPAPPTSPHALVGSPTSQPCAAHTPSTPLLRAVRPPPPTPAQPSAVPRRDSACPLPSLPDDAEVSRQPLSAAPGVPHAHLLP